MAYGNLLTHGGCSGASIAAECAEAALDVVIAKFDTVDLCADGHAEEFFGTAARSS